MTIRSLTRDRVAAEPGGVGNSAHAAPSPARRLLVVYAHGTLRESGRLIPESFDGRSSAVAVFECEDVEWECVAASPALDWMVGLDARKVKHKLDLPRQLWRWQWRWASRFEVAS